MSVKDKSEIAEWYNGKNVLITGATGFMGKVLLEKLLYASPMINNIYILLRHKKGMEPRKRVEEMWKLPMFQRLRDTQPGAYKKVIPINGDINVDNLDLNDNDENQLIENVDVIFHCAAILRLEAELNDAVNMNVIGTRRIAELAKKIKRLKIFLHLSTTFCSNDIQVFKEKIYQCHHDPDDIIRLTEWMDRETINKITGDLIKPHPDTYTYTKRLGEVLIARQADNMRVVVVRPSIVSPSFTEPVPGWVDNLNGPTGLMIAAGKGVVRSMHCNGDHRVQMIPVDVAINAIIAIAWKYGSIDKMPKEVPVYNLTNDGVLRKTWRDVLVLGRQVINDYPLENPIWYPDGNIHNSKIVHTFYAIFFHWLPALFIDFLLLIFLQPRFMIKLQTRIHRGLSLLQFFTTREWMFDSKNFVKLTEEMSDKDREVYPVDINAVPPEEYAKISLLGGRQYVMKEDLSTLPRSRIQIKIMYIIHVCFVYGFYISILYFIYTRFK